MVRGGRLYKGYLVLVSFLLLAHIYISQSHVNLCYINESFSLGIMPWMQNHGVIIVGIVSLPVLFSMYGLFRLSSVYSQIAILISLSALSGLSNLLDRVVHGGVCDYLLLRFGDFTLNYNFNDLILLFNVVLIVYITYTKNGYKG